VRKAGGKGIQMPTPSGGVLREGRGDGSNRAV